MFQGLNISASALRIQQYGINIVSNNIANMNTEGYHKQKLNIGTQAMSLDIGSNPVLQAKSSIGIELIDVSRYTSSIEGEYLRDAMCEKASYQTQNSIQEDIINLFDEIKGMGLEKEIEDYYNAVNSLSQRPNSKELEIMVEDSAKNLIDRFNHLKKDLEKLEKSKAQNQLSQEIDGLNNELKNLANINKLITVSQQGSLENNNLLDKRDAILNNISSYGDFDIDIKKNGSVNISLDGTKIVNGENIRSKFFTDNGIVSIETEQGKLPNANKKFHSGSIKGILNGIEDIKTTQKEFESLSEQFDKIGVLGNNWDNFEHILSTQNDIQEEYNRFLAKISSKYNSTKSSLETQDTLVESIENKIKSETSVDINEELADLVKYQTAMQASSRVFEVCNNVLDVIINLGR